MSDAHDSSCFHGGAFFGAVGDEFDDLTRHHGIINADVLDAWFPPSPTVVEAIEAHLPWLLRTSPPTDCGGMQRVIARVRGVDADCILPGAGSSALIFLAFAHWLTDESRVLILDPMYGEYAHVLENVIGCHVHRFPLSRDSGYLPDMEAMTEAASHGFDLVVLVNPNSPTGRHVPAEAMRAFLRSVPKSTRVWIDETYVEYAGEGQSLEPFAADSENTIVCKSMSKVYALSGVRAAYLCAPPAVLAPLRSFVPPWAVSLPAQVAAVHALQDPSYYAARYRETHELRESLVRDLEKIEALAPMDVVPSTANFVLCHLDPAGPTADQIVHRCREHGVFLRDASGMGAGLGAHALRIAVKDREANAKVIAVLGEALVAPESRRA